MRRALAEASTTEYDEGSNSRVPRICRAIVFFPGKDTHVSYAVHILEDVLVRVHSISPTSRGHWKKKQGEDNKKEKP